VGDDYRYPIFWHRIETESHHRKPGNSALVIPTGQYFTPAGRPIHGHGITPDIECPQDPPEAFKVAAQSNGQKLLQSYVPADPKDDKALNLAYELLRGSRLTPPSSSAEKTAAPD
jgi:carboxyl-terminal processing protease